MTELTDWMPLLVGALAAFAALAGGLLSPWVQHRLAASEAERDAERRSFEMRRDAYLAALVSADHVASLAAGSMATRTAAPVAGEAASDHTRAMAAAELVAPRDVWARMKPYVDAANMRSNAIVVMQRGQAGDFLAAVREDLQR